jgi:hypothetical protein
VSVERERPRTIWVTFSSVGFKAMNASRLLALAVLAASVISMPASAGTTVSRHRSSTRVTVVVRAGTCSVKPLTVATGTVALQLVNKAAHKASFTLDRWVVLAGAKSARTRSLSVAAGRHRYVCLVAGRRVGTGFLIARTPQPPRPVHRIGVREVNGTGELYDAVTGANFVPRGSNYIRLAPQRNASGDQQVYHSTFNVGLYDSAQAEAALTRMSAGGHNVVRVFLSVICVDACVGDSAVGGLRTAYIANLADFLRRAKNHGIVVLLTSEWLPDAYSGDIASVRREWFDHINLLMLSPEGVAAQRHFWSDLAKELLRQKAPTDSILAYELWNEAYLLPDWPPFTLTSGSVKTANGSTYDMANTSDRKRIIDDGFVFLIDQVREAIRKVDPSALVTMGFFHDVEPNSARVGDNRIVRTRAVIDHSKADFVDIHPYPATDLTFPQFMQNYGIDGPTAKPIIMGEFGAYKFAFASAADASTGLTTWQRQSCAYGIDGWLLWTWDSFEQPELWNALDAGGTIEGALSPARRPNPCA